MSPLAAIANASSFSSIASVHQADSDPTKIVFTKGWVSQPNGRGTIDIVWSCVFTIFLCSWSVLCVNVPAAHESTARVWWRKLFLAALAVCGPEFIFQIALGQWVSARQSVKSFQNDGYPDWTLTHAFFADMGGFILTTPGWKPFPIDAKQLHYLVTKGHVPYPIPKLIDKRKIADRNKSEGLVRIIAVGQTLWFILNCIGRKVQNLDLTTLELTTLGLIVPTLGTFFFWYHKPCDVSTAIEMSVDTSIEEILVEAGDRAKHGYTKTPLDFVSRNEWSWTIYWSHFTNRMKSWRCLPFPRGHPFPIDHFPNDNFPKLSPSATVLLFVVHLVYCGIHVCTWDFWFPSKAEMILWRSALIMMVVSIFNFWIADSINFRLLPFLRVRYPHRFPAQEKKSPVNGKWQTSAVRRYLSGVAAEFRNNSPNQDPHLHVPLKAMIPAFISALLYCTSRVYILAEDVANLRSLPSSAYDTVNWSNFLPHV